LAPSSPIEVAHSDTPHAPGRWTDVPVDVGPNGSSENCPGTSPIQGVSTNTCADASEIFTQIATDNAGNAYATFVDYIDTLDKHYDVYLASSTDGGATWDGKKDGSGRPHRVGGS